MRWIIAAAMLPLLAGCMPSTVTELHSRGEHVAFETETSYQQVYRNLLSMTRECAYRGILFDTVTVDGELYPDLGVAEIIHEQNNMGDRSVLFQAEINESGDGSMVSAHGAGVIAQHLPHLAAWAAGSTDCEPTS